MQFPRTQSRVESAAWRTTVEFAEVGVIDVFEGAGGGAEVDGEVEAVDVREVVEIGGGGGAEGELDEGGGGLAGDALALHSEVVHWGAAVASHAGELVAHPLALCSGPESPRYCAA